MKISKKMPSPRPPKKSFRWNTPTPYQIWNHVSQRHEPSVKSDKEIIGNITEPEFMRALSRVLIELMERAEK